MENLFSISSSSRRDGLAMFWKTGLDLEIIRGTNRLTSLDFMACLIIMTNVIYGNNFELQEDIEDP